MAHLLYSFLMTVFSVSDLEISFIFADGLVPVVDNSVVECSIAVVFDSVE